jgi:hypothetical protein
VNIKKVTILLRVKNSTAFATDDEFDRNKRWIASSSGSGGTGVRRRLSSNGVRRSVYPLVRPPMIMHVRPPFYSVKSTASDRHILRDPRLRGVVLDTTKVGPICLFDPILSQ